MGQGINLMTTSAANDGANVCGNALRRLPGLTQKFGIAVTLSFILGACSLIPKAPSTIYDLTAPKNPSVRSGTSAQILVPVPATFKALDTDRIAARPSPDEYAYLPKAVWADRLPALLQARLAETLENTKRVKAVGLPGQGLLIDYQIVIDIRSFEIDGDIAVAAFSVKLMNDRTGRIVSDRIFRATAPVLDKTNPGYVAALDSAMDKSFTKMVAWILAKI